MKQLAFRLDEIIQLVTSWTVKLSNQTCLLRSGVINDISTLYGGKNMQNIVDLYLS